MTEVVARVGLSTLPPTGVMLAGWLGLSRGERITREWDALPASDAGRVGEPDRMEQVGGQRERLG